MAKKLTSGQLDKIATEKRREYHRNWQRENKEKVREYQKRYWRKKALEELEDK